MRMAYRISFSHSCNSKWPEALRVQRRGRAEDSNVQAVRSKFGSKVAGRSINPSWDYPKPRGPGPVPAHHHSRSLKLER